MSIVLSSLRTRGSIMKALIPAFVGMTSFLLLQNRLLWAAPAEAPSPNAAPNPNGQVTPNEMEYGIVGHYKGRLLVKKIVAPVSMNLEKLQDFPEDPSQKILYDPLPISQGGDFNARSDVKGHAPFYPWIPSIPEPPFLTMLPPKGAQPASWTFEVFNPQGQTIFRQRGTNALPDQLIWEGKDSEYKFAVVDRLYSAQLTLVGADEKAQVIQGDSIVLPAMVYGSDQSETVEFSSARLFIAGKAEITPEGVVMLCRIAERIRERGLTQTHVRLQGADEALDVAREEALVNALQKALLLSPGMIEHDHAKATPRGEIAVFWLKRGAQ